MTRRDERKRECECEEIRIMLIRNQESVFVLLISLLCREGPVWSQGLFLSNWSNHYEVSVPQSNYRSAGVVIIHVSLQLWSMAPYISSLWSSESGTPSPFPVISTMLSRDILLEQTVPSHCSRRIITLSLVPRNGLDLFLLLPWTPRGHLQLILRMVSDKHLSLEMHVSR